MQNNLAFQFFKYINGYPHTTRVYSRGNELHWVKTYVGHREFHPTTIHTTSTSHSDGWLSIRSEVTTPFGQQFILSSYCPVSSPLVPPSDHRQHIPPPAPSHYNIFLPVVTPEDHNIWRERTTPESTQVRSKPQTTH